MSEKIVQLNEEVIKGQIKELVRVQAACAFFRGAAFQKQETGKDRKSTRLNSSHKVQSRMPSSA